VEALLACGVSDPIVEHAILEVTLLGEEYSVNCGLFVGLEFVGDLVSLSLWEKISDGKEQQWWCGL
jgi:hypothetical protein